MVATKDRGLTDSFSATPNLKLPAGGFVIFLEVKDD
jgi:hypothetical protein